MKTWTWDKAIKRLQKCETAAGHMSLAPRYDYAITSPFSAYEIESESYDWLIVQDARRALGNTFTVLDVAKWLADQDFCEEGTVETLIALSDRDTCEKLYHHFYGRIVTMPKRGRQITNDIVEAAFDHHLYSEKICKELIKCLS